MSGLTPADVRELFESRSADVPSWVSDPTPKQSENWNDHGSVIANRLESETAQYWYLRTYRPKKRGDGMMERDHVQTGEPEHYYKKHVEGLKRPMGSIQGEVMAGMFLDDETKDEVEAAGKELVRATTTDAEKKRIAEQGEKLASVIGLE